MDFSDCFKQTGCCALSPDGSMVANTVDHRLLVRDVHSLEVLHLFACLDAVQSIEWSCDSAFLLCAMYKRSLVQVWSVQDPDWTCKIDEGAAGLECAQWSPDGRHVLTTTVYNLRMTIWSLVSKRTSYVKLPKAVPNGCKFSHDGEFMVVLERRDCKDWASLFTTSNWELVKHFELDTADATHVAWAPNDRAFCVWDSCLTYRVCVYTPDGRCLANYSAYDNALGIKSVVWSPSSQFLAVGSFDEKARLLNNMTWNRIADLAHPKALSDQGAVVYAEHAEKRTVQGTTHLHRQYIVVQKARYQVPSKAPDADKPNPRLGVGLCAFSRDCAYLATRNDNMASCVWIWSVTRLKLIAVLHQATSVRAVAWHPSKALLAICSGLATVYFWSPSGCTCVNIPTDANFATNHIAWNADGDLLLLTSKGKFCVAYTESVADARDPDPAEDDT